jgi:hypothetical protein
MKVLLIVLQTPLEMKLPLQTNRKGNQSSGMKPSHLPDARESGLSELAPFQRLSNDDE